MNSFKAESLDIIVDVLEWFANRRENRLSKKNDGRVYRNRFADTINNLNRLGNIITKEDKETIEIALYSFGNMLYKLGKDDELEEIEELEEQVERLNL